MAELLDHDLVRPSHHRRAPTRFMTMTGENEHGQGSRDRAPLFTWRRGKSAIGISGPAERD
jgi:hypothetical protein